MYHYCFVVCKIIDIDFIMKARFDTLTEARGYVQNMKKIHGNVIAEIYEVC